MKLHLLSGVIALSLIGVVSLLAQDAPEPTEPAPEARVVLVQSDENLLSKEIWGKWEQNKNFTKWVQDGSPKDDFGKVEVTTSDTSSDRIVAALDKLVATMVERGKPNDLEFARAAKSIYATGRFQLTRGKEKLDADFAILTMFGEQLIILRSGPEDKPEWETARVSFVRHAEGEKDLLFIGTASKTGKFTAMQREGVK